MYNEAIKKLIRKLEILPEVLVQMYLRKKFNLSENMAAQAAHSACRARCAYKVGNCLAAAPYIKMDSAHMKRAKAFRVYLEFIQKSDGFTIPGYPWVLVFNSGVNYVQVCCIDRDMELVSSKVIADKPVPMEDRKTIKRIAIMDPSCSIDRIKAAGFSHFCTVSDNMELKIVAKRSAEEAWNDVPEKV